jgi:crossover junction endodeoxyribonuclease RuvC
MSDCIMGIDPGVTGAIAFFFPETPSRIVARDLPLADGEISAPLLADLIRVYKPGLAIIERVSAMPGQGVVSMFNFGRAYGDVRGVIGALNIPLHFITPQKWKRHFKLSSDKEQARALALRLFPACADSFKLKKHHDRAEAALIARFGAETIGGAK